jgi:CubicO group peptidase (beta-lactamase class C family)
MIRSLAAILVGLFPLAFTVAANAAELSERAKEALSRQLRDAVEHGDTPGAVEIVVSPDRVLYEGAAGKLDTSAIFSIASMTKPVTSVAVMMLVEEGKIALDDPISKYLPGFDNPQVITKFDDKTAKYETRPAKRPITIRHLLTNTSGIGYGFTNPILNRLTQATKKSETELPLLSDPGERWNYSPGTRVLGQLVEKLTGQRLEDFFQSRIFKPLGMTDTSYAVPVAKQARVARQFSRVNGALREQPQRPPNSNPNPPFFGDGGLFSTVQDYGRFEQMILNGGRAGATRILSEKSVKLMSQNQTGPVLVELQPDANKELTKPFPLGAGHDKFGFGFQIASGDPHGYRSAGSLSWAGIFNTEFWIDPVKKIGGVQMMQLLPFYDDGAIRTLRGFEELVYRSLEEREVKRAESYRPSRNK